MATALIALGISHLALLAGSGEVEARQVVRERIHALLAEAEHHRRQQQPARHTYNLSMPNLVTPRNLQLCLLL